MDRADWYDITAPRLSLYQQAFQSGQLPLQGSSSSWSGRIGDRFFSIGDLIVSPQILLLNNLSLGQFALLQTLLMVSLGFWGLLRIRQRYRLSLAAFLPIGWLFFFNGHVVTQLSVGHLTWAGAFLIPFFIDLVLDLFNRAGMVNAWRWGSRVALVEGAMLLQGTLHTFTAVIILLVAIWIVKPRWWKPIFTAIFFSILVSSFRIFPVALMAQALEIPFNSGFTTVNEFLQGLTYFRPIQQALESLTPVTPQVAWWEFDFFIGWVGFAWIVFFGIGVSLRQSNFPGVKPLLGALGIVTLLSIGRIYNLVFLLHIPLLNGERISSRLFLLPLGFLIVLSAIHFHSWLNQNQPTKPAIGWLYLGGLMILISDCRQHYESWKVTELAGLFTQEPVAHTVALVAKPDPMYLTLIGLGAVVSLITLAGLLYLAFAPNSRMTGQRP